MAKHLTVNDGDTVKVMTGLTVSQLPTPVNDTAASDLTYVTFSTNNVKAYAEIDAYGVEYIPDNKFNGDTSITSVIFSNKLNEIGVSSFEGCSNLTGSLTIPDSITSIGDLAFSDCSGLTGSLIIPDSVTTIGSSAFANCSGFTGSLIIPDSVTSIDGGAFAACSGFTGSLTLPNNPNFTSIGFAAFVACSGFTGSLIIPDSVTSISGYAFADCSGFTGSLIIPNSVTSIGQLAFSTFLSLQDIYVNADASIWGTDSLFNSGSGPIYVTSSYISSYGTTFQGHPVVGWTSYPDPMP